MKKTHIIALVFIAISIAVIVSLTGSVGEFETFATAVSDNGMEFKVTGELDLNEEIKYDPQVDPNYFTFYMFDESGEKRKVIFKGEKPQDFERSERIVLTGKSVGDEFVASKMLLKCPSKYFDDGLEIREVKAVNS